MDNIEYNKELCKRYPFLQITDCWTGQPYEDEDYSSTWLDDMPDGWRKAFGKEMLEEIREELIRCDYLNEYRIMQIKEKFGTLRWYDAGVPVGCNVWDIIKKYEDMSAKICINCGKPATKVSKGWISPWCDDCIDKINGQYADIDEWYGE